MLFLPMGKNFFQKQSAAFESGSSTSRVFELQQRKLQALESKLRMRTEAPAELTKEHVR
jgi:hypothetical protein